jgi:predicted esterase
MKRLFTLFAACWIINAASANDQMRQWTFESGQKQAAEIIAFDEDTRIVTLREEDQAIIKRNENEFSALDRAWILQWIELDEEAREMLARVGGTVTREKTTGESAIDYYVYHPAPETIPAGTQPPMMMLFHPGGNGGRAIYRYVEAAAATGFTLVSFDYFRNTRDKESDLGDEMEKRFPIILPQIEANVPHDPLRVFMGGTFGGAMRAYGNTMLTERPWAGIFAGGGWLGPNNMYRRPYPPLRVAMVNGDKDRGANAYIRRDTEMLQSTGGIVSVHAFEGGHQMPPPSVMTKAFRWLLDTELPAGDVP